MDSAIKKEIAVEWKTGTVAGQVRVSDGRLIGMEVATGRGGVNGDRFSSTGATQFRLKISLEGVSRRYTKNPTIVSIDTEDRSFSFFMRDVDSRFPIFIPEYEVVVTSADDERSFAQIQAAIVKRGGRTRLQNIEVEPEESFETAAQNVRRMNCHTWLGLSRNMRIFAIGEQLEWIEPRFHYFQALIPENNQKPFRYEFVMGRGWGPNGAIERHLEERVLPILHGKAVDGEISYDLTTFVTREAGNLTAQSLQGTDFFWLTVTRSNTCLPQPSKRDLILSCRPSWKAEKKRCYSCVFPQPIPPPCRAMHF